MENNKLKVLELFGGIGACSKALERLGVDVEIADYVEIDKFAVKSFNAIHGTSFEPQDITKWDKDIKVDLVMHGSPCQDFSAAGLGRGGDKGSGTRSSLMYETLRIVEKLKPKYVIWENVKNLLSAKHKPNFDAYQKAMADMGYKNFYQVLNAKDYGVPQNRERVFTVSILGGGEFEFPTPVPLEKRLGDILEPEVDEKYYLSRKQLHGMQVTNYHSYKLSTLLKDKGDVADTIKARFEGCPQLIEQPKLEFVGGIGDKDRVGDGKKLSRNYPQGSRVYSAEGIATTLTSQGVGGAGGFSGAYLVPQKENSKTNPCKRIRKLTPKECWRLMSFDDKDIDKAIRAGVSNAQLYKQAGNSIVVSVLEAILGNLLNKGDEDDT